MKPGPFLLMGFLGVWLPIMTRGVLPKTTTTTMYIFHPADMPLERVGEGSR